MQTACCYLRVNTSLQTHLLLPGCSEKASLEKTAQAAQGSSQLLEMEVKKLQLTVTSALRERDHEREQKEAAVVERERAKAESQRM